MNTVLKNQAIHRINTNCIAEYIEGGLWIIGPTRSGKSNLLKRALDELRTQSRTRVVVFNPVYAQNQALYRSEDLDFESLDQDALRHWVTEGPQWLWLSRTTNSEECTKLRADILFWGKRKAIIQNVLNVFSACQQVPDSNYRTIFVIDEIHPIVELVYSITNSLPNIDWVITSQSMEIDPNPKALTKRFRNCLFTKPSTYLQCQIQNLLGESIYIPNLGSYEVGILRDATLLDAARRRLMKSVR